MAIKISVFAFAKYVKDSLDELVTEGRTQEDKSPTDWLDLFMDKLGQDEEETIATVTATESTGDTLDHQLVSFGKHKGKTPEQISVLAPDYIIWAYETLDRRFCSYVLYKDSGGHGQPRWATDRLNTSVVSTHKSTGFDDMDDDIPF